MRGYRPLQQYQCLLHSRLRQLYGQDALIVGPGGRATLCEVLPVTRIYSVGGFLPGHRMVCFHSSRWPFKEKFFDVIIIDHCLPWVDNVAAMLDEAYKKLSSRGQLMLLECPRAAPARDCQQAYGRPDLRHAHSVAVLKGLFRLTGFTAVNRDFFYRSTVKCLLGPLTANFSSELVWIYRKTVTPLTPYRFPEPVPARAAPVPCAGSLPYYEPGKRHHQYQDKEEQHDR